MLDCCRCLLPVHLSIPSLPQRQFPGSFLYMRIGGVDQSSEGTKGYYNRSKGEIVHVLSR